MKYNDNGEYKDIYVKSFDTIPVGAIVECSGQTIPEGWTDIGNDKIQKTSQYINGGASLSNVYGTSNENGYTQDYINGLETYSTTEKRIGTWIDGKPLYQRTIVTSTPTVTTNGTAVWNTSTIGSNIDILYIYDGFIKYGGNIGSIHFTCSSSSSEYFARGYTNIESGNAKLHITNNTTSYNDAVAVATIRYTKTTD